MDYQLSRIYVSTHMETIIQAQSPEVIKASIKTLGFIDSNDLKLILQTGSKDLIEFALNYHYTKLDLEMLKLCKKHNVVFKHDFDIYGYFNEPESLRFILENFSIQKYSLNMIKKDETFSILCDYVESKEGKARFLNVAISKNFDISIDKLLSSMEPSHETVL